MIENWKKAYKMLSIWVFAIAGSLAGIFARLVRQPSLGAPETVVDELRRIKSIAKKGGLISLVLLASVGCTKADMLKVVNTADDAAKVACSLFFSEHQSISVHDAAKMFCDTREAIDVFLASQKQAGEEMAAAQGLARK